MFQPLFIFVLKLLNKRVICYFHDLKIILNDDSFKEYINSVLFVNLTRPNLDLLCVWQSDAVPFCENYTKLYFDAKHLEKGLVVSIGCHEHLLEIVSKRCSLKST